MRLQGIVCLGLFAASVATGAAAPEPPPAQPLPVELFTDDPDLAGFVISPSGKFAAATQRSATGQLLTIAELPSLQGRKSFEFGERLDAADVHFVDDDHLLVEPARLLPGLRAGKVLAGEILRVDVQTGSTSMLYSALEVGGAQRAPRRGRTVWVTGGNGTFEDVTVQTIPGGEAGRIPGTVTTVNRVSGREYSPDGFGTSSRITNPGQSAKQVAARRPVQILSMRSNTPGDILIQTMAGLDGRFPATASRLNVRNGQLAEVMQAPMPDARFTTGPAQRIALAQGTDEEGRSVVLYLPAGKAGVAESWVTKVVTRREQGELIPVAWTGKDEKYYALDSRDAPTRGVVIWDAASSSQELLFRNPDADIVAFEQDATGKAWMFAGYDPYPFYWYPDPQHPLALMHQKLATGLPKMWIEVTGHAVDMARAAVRVSSAEQPPLFLIVDVASAQPLTRLESFTGLKGAAMAPVQPIEFKARDGLAMRGFLTLPRDSKDQKLPMIVSVHGGPHGVFDGYDYEYERQLFASRGYAVLQVNYRGSGGRGRDFMAAGFGKWGREMQDDVTDGVRWAIQQGIADERRICIYGGSFGAFAALTGVAREPQLFRCAVGFSGIYDLSLLFDTGGLQASARGLSYLKEAVGEGQQELKTRSPVNMAQDIRARVLLIHGTEDSRAPLEHASRMRQALTSAGNPPEWLVAEAESHSFGDPGNRAAAYRAMLDFFAANLAGPPGVP
jgi:acetyl esterase/lipase